MAPKVSVVVATYAPGEKLDALVRSVERQTLPADEFEVVLVDDGSPDDTWDRLQTLRDGHGNVRVERIEASGWPSRPRNVGTDLALGEYVLYMDHDDELFPDGLRDAWEFARSEDVDILSVREVKSSSPGFGFEAYLRDVSGPAADLGVMSLVPMMPHKLYRRRMLLAGGVRFPERPRAFWEDVFFNVDAFVRAGRTGTLAHRAVYRRNMGKGNASRFYRPQHAEFWDNVMLLLQHVDTTLGGPGRERDRTDLLAYLYRTRVLHNVRSLLVHGHAAALPMALPYVRTVQERWVTAERARGLPWRDRHTDALLRAGDLDRLSTVSTELAGVRGVSRLTAAGWDGDRLELHCVTSWRGDPAQHVTPLPATAAETVAVHRELETARSRCVLLERDTRETHPLDTTLDGLEYDVDDPLMTLRLRTTTRLPVGPGGYDDVVDVQADNAALGFVNQRGVRTPTTAAALVDGRAVVAYPNTGGTLSVDFGQRLRSLVNATEPDVRAAHVERSPDRLAVRLPLPAVHVWGRTRIEGSVLAHDEDDGAAPVVPLPAALVGDEEGARVEMTLPATVGTHRLGFDFTGREVRSPLVLVVPRLHRRPYLRTVTRRPDLATVLRRRGLRTALRRQVRRLTPSRPGP